MRQPSELPDSLKNIDIKRILRKRGMYMKLKYNKELKEAAIPVAKQLLAKKKTEPPKQPKHPQFTDEQVMEYWKKQIHIVETLEKHFEKKVEQFVNKVVRGFLAHLDDEIAVRKQMEKAKGYFEDTENELMVAAQLDFAPILGQQATLAGQEAYKLIGVKDVYLPNNVTPEISKNVAKFTSSMLDTDRDKLIKALSDGLSDGKSIPEIRKQIEDDFDEYSKMQAERITRTEVLRTSTDATLDAYEQSGVVEGKQWLTAGAIDECAQYDGQVETLNANFYATSEFADGDPPLHPNCRCVLLPVVVGEDPLYTPKQNTAMLERIKELEGQIDKRTKDFKQLQAERADDSVYIKSLEKYLGVDDESQDETG